ncbi:MAG: rod shape-determining protein MreC [Parcubacteria group bacterium]
MKVNYLPKNRLRHPYLRRIVILVTIFIFGAIVFSFLDVVILSIISPVWKAENQISRSLRNSATLFGSQKALVEENAALKERLYSLEAELLFLSMGRVQENTLLELVGRKGQSNMMAVAVLTHPPQTPYDVIIIDAGLNESITIGSQVLLPEGPLLGTVSEVFPKSAKVKLFSADGEETNAILERNDVPVTLVGTGGGNFRLAIPRDIAIEKGDRILSAGIISRPLATVGEVNVQPTDSFKAVLAKIPINIFTIRFVFVTP